MTARTTAQRRTEALGEAIGTIDGANHTASSSAAQARFSPIPQQQRIALTFDGLPPSSNALYPSLKSGRRVLSQAGRDWHRLVALTCSTARVRGLGWPQRDGICVAIEVVNLGFRRDLENCAKATIDALTEALDFDDRWIVELTMRRVAVLNKPALQETRVVLSEVQR